MTDAPRYPIESPFAVLAVKVSCIHCSAGAQYQVFDRFSGQTFAGTAPTSKIHEAELLAKMLHVAYLQGYGAGIELTTSSIAKTPGTKHVEILNIPNTSGGAA